MKKWILLIVIAVLLIILGILTFVRCGNDASLETTVTTGYTEQDEGEELPVGVVTDSEPSQPSETADTSDTGEQESTPSDASQGGSDVSDATSDPAGGEESSTQTQASRTTMELEGPEYTDF